MTRGLRLKFSISSHTTKRELEVTLMLLIPTGLGPNHHVATVAVELKVVMS